MRIAGPDPNGGSTRQRDVACSLAVVAVAVLLPFTPAGELLGFVAPPAFFFLILTVLLIFYLLAVEGMKQWFFRRFAAE